MKVKPSVVALLAALSAQTSLAHADPYSGPRIGGGGAEFISIVRTHTSKAYGLEDPALTSYMQSICQALKNGLSREQVLLYYIQGQGWSDNDAAWFATAAAVSYCPAYILPSDRW